MTPVSKPLAPAHARRATLAGALAAALLLHGCAATPTAPAVLVLPGARSSMPQYQADDGACRQFAQQQVAPAADAANNQAAGSALLGAAAGAAIGALIGYGAYGSYGNYANLSAAWGAGTGLMYGGAVGVGSSQAANGGLQQRYDTAYAQCMVGRGHQLPGMVTRSAVPALPPPPPGYMPPRAQPPAVPPPGTLPPAMPPPGTLPPQGIAPT